MKWQRCQTSLIHLFDIITPNCLELWCPRRWAVLGLWGQLCALQATVLRAASTWAQPKLGEGRTHCHTQGTKPACRHTRSCSSKNGVWCFQVSMWWGWNEGMRLFLSPFLGSSTGHKSCSWDLGPHPLGPHHQKASWLCKYHLMVYLWCIST